MHCFLCIELQIKPVCISVFSIYYLDNNVSYPALDEYLAAITWLPTLDMETSDNNSLFFTRMGAGTQHLAPHGGTLAQGTTLWYLAIGHHMGVPWHRAPLEGGLKPHFSLDQSRNQSLSTCVCIVSSHVTAPLLLLLLPSLPLPLLQRVKILLLAGSQDLAQHSILSPLIKTWEKVL